MKALGAKVAEKVEPQKRRFWTAQEDELLCKEACVKVSADPVIGNNQTAETFWTRVNDEFGAACLRDINKDNELWVWDSIRSRFQRHIQKCTTVSNTVMTRVVGRNEQAKEICLEMEGRTSAQSASKH